MSNTDNRISSGITNVAIIQGSDTDTSIVEDRNIDIYVWGNNDADHLFNRLAMSGRIKWNRFHITKNYFRQRKVRWDFKNYDIIYNSISDRDQNPKVLLVAKKMLKNSQLPVLNHPKYVKDNSRSAVSKLLSKIPGIHHTRTIKIDKPNFNIINRRISLGHIGFPMLLKIAGQHSNRNMRICYNTNDICDQLPDAGTSIYLNDYVDYASSDGLFRKFRFFRIGDKIIFRHLVISDNWNIHVTERDRFMKLHSNLFFEEKFFYNNSINSVYSNATSTLMSVAKKCGLEYMGIDCGFMPDGKILIFEANATMNFFAQNPTDPLNCQLSCLNPSMDALENLLVTNISASDKLS